MKQFFKSASFLFAGTKGRVCNYIKKTKQKQK